MLILFSMFLAKFSQVLVKLALATLWLIFHSVQV